MPVHLQSRIIDLRRNLLALGALAQGEPRLMFLWLVLAFIIDASDGVLARRARVHHYTPHLSLFLKVKQGIFFHSPKMPETLFKSYSRAKSPAFAEALHR